MARFVRVAARSEAGEVECPWHGSRFDPFTREVRVQGQDVEVEI